MSDEMRVLTVRQPWAWAIFHGGTASSPAEAETRMQALHQSVQGLEEVRGGCAGDR